MTPPAPHQSPPWGTTTKAIVAVFVLVLTALLVWRFRDLLTPLILAALLAYILNPFISWIDVRTPLSRSQTVLIVYLVLLLIVLAGMTAIGFVAVDQVLVLSEAIPRWTAQAVTLFPELPSLIPAQLTILGFSIDLTSLQTQVQNQFDLILNPAQIDWRAIGTQIVNLIQPVFSLSGSWAANVLQATAGVVGLILLIFVISIYMAVDAPRFSVGIGELAQQPGYRVDAELLLAQISKVWAAYFRGQVILGIIIFVVVSVVLGLLGVSNALGLGVLSGVMEFLPIIGPVVGAGAAILVALFQQEIPWGLATWQYVLIITAAMFLIQQLENNILVPRIVGDALDLHPLLVMVSVIMGSALAGLLGAVLAAPVVASAKILGTYAWRKMLDLDPFPPQEATPPPPSPMQEVPSRLNAAWSQVANTLGRLIPDFPLRRTPTAANEGTVMNDRIYPLQFAPVFKDYPWGGRNLETVLGRAIPPGIVAESWEISAHPNGQTKVLNGPLTGSTLAEVQRSLGLDLVGTRNRHALELGKFPLLIKLLDANQWLSVQVHPDDAYALAHVDEFGKTEMWVILHAKPGAELIYGLKSGIDRAAFAQAIAEGRSQDALHRVAVQAGDVVFVPAGTVHALGPGIIVAEIQQNSDTTYRIYDWDRLGNDGKPRPLHVEEALKVINWQQVEPKLVKPEPASAPAELLAECPYFRTERLTLTAGETFNGRCTGETFEIWAVLEGAAALTWADGALNVLSVGWALLPASLGEFSVRAEEKSVLLRIWTP